MICAKCGTQNAAGDAFCGSCGAFLEFAAEDAGTPGTQPAQAPLGASTHVPVPPAEAAATPAIPVPAPAVGAPPVSSPAVAPTAAPSSLAPSGPTCPSCGRANPAGRTFCISCGERLPAAGRPASMAARSASAPPPAAASIPATPAGAASSTLGSAALAPPAAPPAAPKAPTGPTWEFPTEPARPVVPPGGRPDAAPGTIAPAAPRRRRGSPLPLIVGAGILFLLLAGGGAAVLLGGKASPSPSAPALDASAAASAALPGASTAVASLSAASIAPSAAPATLPPGPSIGLTLTGSTASSSPATHPASAAIDGDPTTAWKTGTADPSDQWIQVTFAPAAVTRIQIWNGWQRTQDFYGGNDRPRNVSIRFDNGTPIPLKLVDVYGSQRVDIPPELGIVGVTRLRITILDWYPAKKTPAAGSPTTQAAISEIRLYGIPVTP